MSFLVPNIAYPDVDSPENSQYIIPDIPIEDYIKQVIPGYRLNNYVYFLLPTFTRTASSVYLTGGTMEGWESTRAYDALLVSEQRWVNVSCGWSEIISFEYPPEFEGVIDSPFGVAPPDTVTPTSYTSFASVDYFGPPAIVNFPQIPGINFYFYGKFLWVQDHWEMLDPTNYAIGTTTVTSWHLFRLDVSKIVDDIVILIPILTALLLPLSLALTANSGAIQTIAEQRRRKR